MEIINILEKIKNRLSRIYKKAQPIIINKELEKTENNGIFHDDNKKWCYRNKLTKKMQAFMLQEVKEFKYKPKFSIVMPVYNTNRRYLVKALNSVLSQLYEKWEVCIVNDGSSKQYIDKILRSFARADKRFKHIKLPNNTGIANATNEALKIAKGDFILSLDHDDIIEKDLLLQVTKYLQKNRDADIIYADNDRIDENDNLVHSDFRPDWSPELLFSFCYITHPKLYSRNIIKQTGIMNENYKGAQDYEYLLRLSEKAKKICHIPLILYHWRITAGQASRAEAYIQQNIEKGRRAVVNALIRKNIDWVDVIQPDWARKSHALYKLIPKFRLIDKVSIIIIAKDNYEALKNCISSLEKNSKHDNCEIIIADAGSIDPKTILYLRKLNDKCKIIRLESSGKPFNIVYYKNIAAKFAAGDYLLFIDAEVQVITDDLIEQMLIYAKMPEVGIVGAKLVSNYNKVMDGLLIKSSFDNLAYPAFKGLPSTDKGYMYRAAVAGNCSMVSGKCMMIKKHLFIEENGYDEENFTSKLYDADLCLRVLSKGRRIVYNPYAEVLLRNGSAKNIDQQDEINFIIKWKDHKDSFYNINLSLKASQLFKEAAEKNNRMQLFDLSKRKIKILAVCHNLNLEGAPKIRFAVDKFLNSQDNIEIEVLSPADGPLHKSYEELGIKVTINKYEKKCNIKSYLKTRKMLSSYIKRGGYDLVIANTLETFWAVDASSQAKVPCIWNIHESPDYFRIYNENIKDISIRRIATKSVFLLSNRNVFACNSTAEGFNKYNWLNNNEVICNGVDVDEIQKYLKYNKASIKKELRIPKNKKVVSIFGTTYYNKAQLDFVKAGLNILKKRNDVCFLIVGAVESKYLDKIKKLIKDQNNIFIINKTPEVMKYYRITDIQVCASAYGESLPLVILEGMAFSLPIVTTPIWGIKEAIKDGFSGLFFKPHDINQMQKNIVKLLDDKKYAGYLGKNANQTVKTLFTEKKMVESYKKLIEAAAMENVERTGNRD